VVNEELDRVIDCVAVFGEPFTRADEFAHVALLQTDGFAAVALKQCLLS
jgi:hypothetical protein